MRILLIRHGDPDYEHDSLTEKGAREADYLARKLVNERIDYAYVSSMGRAQATAAPTLKAKNMKGIDCDWLREFCWTTINRPDKDEPKNVCWDWLPQDWTKYEEFYRYDEWFNHPIMAEAGIGEYAKMVREGIDELLKQHGYVRDGHIYRVEKANDDTIALFGHFGSGALIAGHLIGASPMVLWHGMAAAPTSVTTIMTEERREGIASFRITCYGDTTHLYENGEEPSFSARFCEMYKNADERHD